MPSTCECDLSGNGAFENAMVRLGPNPMARVSIKWGKLRHTHTEENATWRHRKRVSEGRQQCEDRSRGCSVSTSHNVTHRPPCGDLSEPPQETNSNDTLILDIEPPNCESLHFCSLSHPICDGNDYRSQYHSRFRAENIVAKSLSDRFKAKSHICQEKAMFCDIAFMSSNSHNWETPIECNMSYSILWLTSCF